MVFTFEYHESVNIDGHTILNHHGIDVNFSELRYVTSNPALIPKKS